MINEDSDCIGNIRLGGQGSRRKPVSDAINWSWILPIRSREYLINKLKEVFSSCNVKYVKWDYNRNITDMYGKTLENQGEFFHRYIMGFYEIMEELTQSFPDILFEAAPAAEPLRFGNALLFPANLDERRYRLFGEDLHSNGNELRLSPFRHHQPCQRHPQSSDAGVTPLSSRFNLACFGNLGYELNLLDLSRKNCRK